MHSPLEIAQTFTDLSVTGRATLHQDLTSYKAKGWTFLGGATNRNTCAYCENELRDRGMALYEPKHPGRVKAVSRIFSYMSERIFGPK